MTQTEGIQIVEIEHRWRGLLEPEWILALDANAFLSRCRAGEITRLELHEFIAQQYFYSRHFTRYLHALLSNLENERDRMALTSNLLEEIGFGDAQAKPHSALYRELMQAMGIDVAKRSISPVTETLVSTMLELCRASDPIVGLSALCLGAEAIVPHVYSQIVRGFLSVGEPLENLEFFRLHIEEDDAHAVTLGRILTEAISSDPLKVSLMKLSALRAIQARIQFFEALSHSRQEKKGIDHVPFQLERFRQDELTH